MRMKKYQAPSMAAAVEAIRAELGPNAVILHSAEVRRGPLGLLSGPSVEVVAAVDQPPTRPRSGGAPLAQRGETLRNPERMPTPVAVRPARPVAEPTPAPAANGEVGVATLREMQQHVRELRGAIGSMMRHAQWPGLAKLAPPLVNLYQSLTEQEVEPNLAQELVTSIDAELSLQAANDPRTVLDCLAKHLRRRVLTTGPLTPTRGEPTVLFLIGPTGVGKTTTIAKLAASLAMSRHRVALITCDTYRIAAIPQLQTYADILGLPLEVAYSPDELTGKVLDHVACDFVIVDTPGRSQRNADQIEDLRRYVMAVPARRTLLSVAAGSRYRDMLDVVARFGTIPFDGLLMTKLDETSTYGPLLSLVCQTGKPLTYLTNGQNVPHDILVASSADVSELLLNTTVVAPPIAHLSRPGLALTC